MNSIQYCVEAINQMALRVGIECLSIVYENGISSKFQAVLIKLNDKRPLSLIATVSDVWATSQQFWSNWEWQNRNIFVQQFTLCIQKKSNLQCNLDAISDAN